MKSKILSILRCNKDRYISGQQLSSNLGISRTAVWKHINALKKKGYDISSITNKGYKLISCPDKIVKEEILNSLKTKYLGSRIYHFSEVDSTNTIAKKLAREGSPSGTLVIADKQVGGRGRLGRNWHSPAGGIWMSLILRPNLQPSSCPGVTLITALSLAKTMKNYLNIPALIKWPNDILINKKKVCGILTEMNAELDKVHHIIIGIGINANNNISEFSESLQNHITSLKIEHGREIDCNCFIKYVLQDLENLLENTGGHLYTVIEDIKKLSHTLGKEINVKNMQGPLQGKAIDIDSYGSLLIKTKNGKLQRITSGDIL